MTALKIIGIIAAVLGTLLCTFQLVSRKDRLLLWLVGMFASALTLGLLLRTFT